MLLPAPPKAFTTTFFVNSYKYCVPFSTSSPFYLPSQTQKPYFQTAKIAETDLSFQFAVLRILQFVEGHLIQVNLHNMSDSFCSFLSATPNSTHNSHAPPKITTISSIAQPFCICTHCNHLLTFNHHVGHVAEEGTSNKGSNVQAQQSSRWSPTAVQLLLLEELYRQGMKTPSAERIQQIASQLRQFGKIEGKNVFYWFQNHKARERQKRRRREMEETAAASSTEGLKETGCGVKETKKWASTSNCSGHAEESAAALDIAEKSSTGWAQFEEREDIQVLRKNIAAERNAKCQNIMEMPPCCCFPPNFTMPTNTTSVSVAAYRTTTTTRNNTPLLTPPQNYALNRESFNYYEEEEEENADPPRTLDLFPLKRDGQTDIYLAQRKSMETDQITSSEQFFEFLPLRN